MSTEGHDVVGFNAWEDRGINPLATKNCRGWLYAMPSVRRPLIKAASTQGHNKVPLLRLCTLTAEQIHDVFEDQIEAWHQHQHDQGGKQDTEPERDRHGDHKPRLA